MVFELTQESIIAIIGIFGSAFFGLWMRSVSAHNALSEQRSEALQHSNDLLKKELDDLSDCLQDTRETYVTNVRFDKLFDMMMSKFDAIMQKLETKPDRQDCLQHTKNEPRRRTDYEKGVL